jgi:hypothetical protein
MKPEELCNGKSVDAGTCSKPFCMEFVALSFQRSFDIIAYKVSSKPVISGEFRCVSADKKSGHTPVGNLWMTGFDCTEESNGGFYE